MTVVGEAELPVVALPGTFTADLLKIADAGAKEAGRVAAESFQKSFVTGLRSSSVGGAKFGTAAFGGLDIEAAKAGIAGGKAYSSGFTESLRTAGAIKIVTQDPKQVASSQAAGLAGGRAYSRGFNAGAAEGKATASFEQHLRSAELASGASGRRAGIAFLSSFKGGLLPLAALIGTVFAVKENTDFTATLTRLQTQAGASAEEVANVRRETLKLSPQVGIGPEKLADGFYHLESAGFRAKEALEIETAAAKESRIGHADLGVTVQALIGLEASHIKGISSATQAVSVLNTIVGNGDLKLQDLAKSLGTGAVAASSIFGLSIQDLGGALDTLTDNTVRPQEAMTRLRMTIALIGAPSGPAIKALNEIGLSSTALGDDLRKPHGLVTALQDLEKHLKGSGQTATEQAATLAHIFGGGRSSGAVDILLTQMDRLQLKTDQLYASTASGGKVFDEAWATTERTTKQKLASLGAGFQVLAIQVGHDLEGPVNGTLNLIHDGFAAAPRVLKPLGDGLVLVAHQAGDLLHAVQPVGRLLIEAFGGTVYVTVQAAAFLLRDVVAPAIHGVTDVVTFLGDHTAVLAGVGTVIAVTLVPALAGMAIALASDVAASAAFVAINLAGAIEGAARAAIGFVAANPILAGTALVLGGLAAVFATVDQSARSFTIDVQGLNSAVADLEKTGNQKPLATTILDDLSNWKPTKAGNVDAITYLQRYGVTAGDLAKQLADPANLAGIRTFTDTISQEFFQNQGLTNTRAKAVARDLQDLKPALDSTNPAVATLAHGFQRLLNDKTVSLDTIQSLANEFFKLGGQIDTTKTRTDSLQKAQDELNRTGHINLDLLKHQATANQSVSAADQLVAAANKDLASQQEAYNKEIGKFGDVVQSQFPIFEGYQAQINVTTQDIINNLAQQISAITNEQANINTLASRGASPAVISALYAKGPEWVQAAAKGTDDQLTQINHLVGDRGNDLKNLAFGAGIASGDSIITGYAATLQEKATFLKIQQQAVFTKQFSGIATELQTIASDAGRNLPDNVAEHVLAGRLKVLASMTQGLTGPAKTTVQQLAVLAQSGGTTLASQLATAIATHTPLVVTKAEKLKIDTNKQIQAIIKTWGITVTVDDQASQKLKDIQTVVNNLGLSGVASTSFTPSLAQQASAGTLLPKKATGGPIDGAGPRGVDSQLILAAPGEHMLTTSDVDAMGGHAGVFAFRRGLQRLADGGPVLGTHITINADSVVDKLSQVAAPANIGGSGVTRWLPIVLEVLAMLGQSAALAPRVLAQINTESGGNPLAIQGIQDSNSAQGILAEGILQTIPTTFAAYAGPYAALGPLNAFADIYAGINYAIHRYPNDPNHGLGYGHGYDAGGVLPVGATLAVNKTGAPEQILTAAQWASIGRLVAAIAALTPASIEKLVTTGVSAAGAQISAAVKEGNGPLAVALENQLKAAEGRLYVTGLGAAGNPTQANKEAVTQASIQVATLTGQLKSLNTVNAGLVTSLNNFVQAQQQYQQTLLGAVQQGNSFTDVLQASGSPGDVSTVLGDKLGRVKSFAAKLTALKTAGFTPALIREVAADGITNGSLYADLLLGSTKAQVTSINADYLALGAGQTTAANNLTRLTEGAIPGITKASAGVYIQQAIFTSGANIDHLVGQAEYAQRTAKMDSGGMLAPGRTVVDNQTGRPERVLDPDATAAYDRGRGGVSIGKYEAHYNGVDLATAHAQSNRDLSLALAGARVGG